MMMYRLYMNDQCSYACTVTEGGSLQSTKTRNGSVLSCQTMWSCKRFGGYRIPDDCAVALPGVYDSALGATELSK